MGVVIRVGIAALDICQEPDTITTIGLGSCVGVVIYDPNFNIGGLVHVMLPDSKRISGNENRAKFADTGIADLVMMLRARGCMPARMRAKIAGGAKMFSFGTENSALSIGDQNIAAVKKTLMSMNIPIVAEDVGLDYGRTILFDPVTKALKITAATKPEKVL